MKTKDIRRHIVFLLVFSMILSNLGFVFADNFSDITNHWAKSEIESWIDRGLIEGYSDGTFRPNNNITRAEFMTLINRAFGYTKEDRINYSDVSSNDWFYSQVAKAKAAGYISGYPDGTMKPNNPISRQEAAIVIMRIKGLEENVQKANSFADYNKIPDWSQGAIGAVLEATIFEGYPDGTFKGENPIKRAEAVVALGKAMGQAPEADKEQQPKPETGSDVITYDKPGVYGPSKDIETISKDVVISSEGVILQNLIIKGNLTLDKKIGEGDATLKSVTVEGDTFIYGGGENSIIVDNSNLNKVTIDKENNKVRVVISGSTVVKEAIIKSKAKLEVADKSVIEILNIDAAATITGKATIKLAKVNVPGVTFEKMPDKLEKAKGITVQITGGAVSGGGGGGGYSPSPGSRTITYDRPGTYGPETGITTVNGNVIIKSDGVTIRNMKITGDLTLHENIGEGDVTVQGVTVQGSTHVNGGGSNSIHFEDSVLLTVIVNKNNRSVRIVATGNTSVTEVKLQSSAIVAESGLSGQATGFATISLDNTMPANSDVTLEGTFETVNTIATNVRITLSEGTNVNRLILDAVAQIIGTGSIRNAEINASGSTLSSMPTETLIIPRGVTAEIEGEVHDDSSSFVPDTIIESIDVTLGSIQLKLQDRVLGTTIEDFVVTAMLDGSPYELQGLQYQANTNRFNFMPVSLENNIGKEFKVTVIPAEHSTKVGGSAQTNATTVKHGFEGRITDVYGIGVEGMTIKFRSGVGVTEGDVIKTVTTGKFGYYSVELAPGMYTGELEKEGFLTTYLISTSLSNAYNVGQNETAIREAGEDEIKIVLTWAEHPRDLDSHLVGPTPNGQIFHTWYGVKTYSYEDQVYVDLDWDDTNSYGPETTTIRKVVDGRYQFYVHHYSGENTLRSSSAKVEVYKGSELLQTYTVPSGAGTERYWTVFDMLVDGENIQFESIHRMSNSEPTGEEYVPVERVALDQETMTLIAGGETKTLVATVYPENATDKEVIWTSSDRSVATVNNGIVTPVASGTAIITATTVDGGKTATSTVTVEAAPVKETVDLIANQSLGMPTSKIKVKFNGQLIDSYTLYFDEIPLASTENGTVIVATEVLKDLSRIKVRFNNEDFGVTVE